MQVDESGVLPMWIPQNLMFTSNNPKFLVIHKTAGFHSAQEVAAYFQSGSNGFGVSSHYIIDQTGIVVQCVPESMGAGANCCITPGHAAFIPESWDGKADNGNVHSISIEHVDPSLDNSTPVTPAQKRASFILALHICQRWHIPMRYPSPDGLGGICGHNAIDPVNRAKCPGNYPLGELFTFLRNTMDHREEQAAIIWRSTAPMLSTCYGKEAAYSTPIAISWQALIKRGLKPGPPVTPEYQAVDWAGNTITCQEFTQAHAEVDAQGNLVFFYDAYGSRI